MISSVIEVIRNPQIDSPEAITAASCVVNYSQKKAQSQLDVDTPYAEYSRGMESMAKSE